jgi:hypothetical protein
MAKKLGRRKHSNTPKKRKGRKSARRPDFNYQTGEVIHTADRLRSEPTPESEEI